MVNPDNYLSNLYNTSIEIHIVLYMGIVLHIELYTVINNIIN